MTHSKEQGIRESLLKIVKAIFEDGCAWTEGSRDAKRLPEERVKELQSLYSEEIERAIPKKKDTEPDDGTHFRNESDFYKEGYNDGTTDFKASLIKLGLLEKKI